MTLRNRSSEPEFKGMTTAQKVALWKVWRYDGVRPDGLMQIGEGKWAKVDARTIVALVARSFLHGCDGRIVVTEEGAQVARML